MQRVVAAAAELAVDGDEVLHAGDLGREDDAVARQADLLGQLRRLERGDDQRLAHHRAGVPRLGAAGVVVHHPGEDGLVQTAPVDADAHRLVPTDGLLDDGRELRVALGALADVAGVDAVLGEQLRALRELLQQGVTVVVEVADQRDADAKLVQLLDDGRHCGGRFFVVDGDADHLAAGARKLCDLPCGADGIRRVGVGHRLHDDRGVGADQHITDADHARTAARHRSGVGGKAGGCACRQVCGGAEIVHGASRFAVSVRGFATLAARPAAVKSG